MYSNIELILASKHKKELAIQKQFEDAFQAKIFVPSDYDTDRFGTFTGEIERQGTPYETVIAKAKEAGKAYGFDYAIANEGSFGPHPTICFSPGDVELMAFVDFRNDIVVVESEITTETNYAHLDITILDEYEKFLENIKFGSHGLILRALDNNNIIAKGINQIDDLCNLLKLNFQQYQTIRLETDMRAMMNPTRMKVINKLASKLVDRLRTNCKKCSMPGFGELSVSGRLLCEDCGSETEVYLHRVFQCVKCEHQEHFPRVDGLTQLDSKYCPYCNP